METRHILQIVSNRFITTATAQAVASEHPIAFATMGAPGAGKTTFLNAAAALSEGDAAAFLKLSDGITQLTAHPTTVTFQNIITVNPDDVRNFMATQPEIQALFHTEQAPNPLQALYQSHATPEAIQEFHDFGNLTVERMVATLAINSVSFILDSTLDALSNRRGDQAKVEQLLSLLSAKHYEMHFFPIIADADTALTRTQQKFDAGIIGFLDEETICAQADSTLPNMQALMTILDRIDAPCHIHPFISPDGFFEAAPTLMATLIQEASLSQEHAEL
jgi:hypothetical protein